MKRFLLALVFTLGVQSSSFGGQCDAVYPHGTPVKVKGTVEYCSSFFNVMYSNDMKGPLVSFESVPHGNHDVPRVNSFRQDERIPKQYRASVGDFLNTGCDKGHMTPFDDAIDSGQGRETFRMSNMTCQAKILNEVKWRMAEARILNKSESPANVNGITYVATGAIYGPETFGKNNVRKPIAYYKIAWYPSGQTEAIYALNRDDATVDPVSIDWINKKTGMKFPLK